MAENILGASGNLLHVDNAGLAHVFMANGSINVDVTVSDYISVVGSPNYNLPIIVPGSVQTWSQGASSNTYVASGDNMKVWVASGANLLGSFFVSNLPTTYQIIGSPNYNLPITGSVLSNSYVNGVNTGWQDTSFASGDSPASLDVNANLSRNGRLGFVANDGAGSIAVNISNDGTNYGGSIIMFAGEVLPLDGIDTDTVKLTWLENTSYRVVVW